MQSEGCLGNNNVTFILAKWLREFLSQSDNGNVLPQDIFNHIGTNKTKILLSLLYFKCIIYLENIEFFNLNHCVRVYAFLQTYAYFK